ncbi:MAG: hypothetical protein F7C07_00330 [Desulfurococcales archaeon]|nr:hypothetical protein [Desulfurococcales archaeon]
MLKTWVVEDGSPYQILASFESLLERKHLGRKKLVTTHSTIGLVAEWPEVSRVLGFFSKASKPLGDSRVYRRITGGPPIDLREGGSYAAIVGEYPWSLRSLYKDLKPLMECFDEKGFHGGASRDGETVIGLTKLAKAPSGVLVEVLTNKPLEELVECLSKYYGGVESVGSIDPDLVPTKAADRLRSPEWLRLESRSYNIESVSANDEGFYVRFTAWVEEELIHWMEVEGNFYAYPPAHVLAIVGNVSQVPPSPGLEYEFLAAWSSFIDVAGINFEDVERAFRELLRKAGGDF